MRALKIIFLLSVLFSVGCASVPYHYGTVYKSPLEYEMPPGEPQIERGRPHGFLDAADWYWPGSLLTKLVLFNWKMDRHHISEETERAIATYLDKNDLPNVKVRLNQYRPGAEWKRLFKNKAIGPFWRYTLGVFATAAYTILPGRFFGGDNYNPYTNTINIYSDIPAVALHEGGHAKDSSGRKWRGTYAAIYAIPGVALWHEAVASNDAISYMRADMNIHMEKQGYKMLYPAYGTYVGGTFGDFIPPPWNYVALLGGVIPGHIIGRTKAALLDEEDRVGSSIATPVPAR